MDDGSVEWAFQTTDNKSEPHFLYEWGALSRLSRRRRESHARAGVTGDNYGLTVP